ncbi:unnamed protein product [Mytilus edulis]|uniref:Uncharacterized protein n=1 Tax=Mytilus edulis TaxID=6550 RepID=A0A8S3S7X6_MYTED|nr:unnamed protein product [Mytilus edulis]
MKLTGYSQKRSEKIINDYGLVRAAKEGNVEDVKGCLQFGADINYKDNGGLTSLMYAADRGHLEVASLLILIGCDKEAKTYDGKTALHLAAKFGHLQVTRYLVEHACISPLATTHQGKSPYDLAAAAKQGKYKEVMAYLELQEANTTSRKTSSGRHEQIPSQIETVRGFQEPPIHTAHSIQDDLLEKIKKGTYSMNIAPSDLVDFGGQKSFDMTHQLFIQHRGTFILMFDGRKGLYTELEEYEQEDVTAASILVHWINSVLTYCNKSVDKIPRIVFAATHSDSFTEVCLTVLNATDPAIDGLKDTLVDIAFQQSTWGQQMPIVWVPLDLQISDMRAHGVRLITKERLLEMNKSNKELALNERRVDDFLNVQHSIGKLLYFDEPNLRDFVVIQPSAMVNILRAFITDKMFWPKKEPFEEYVVQVLLHLDILVEPKRYKDIDTAADLFLVPCIVKTKIPRKMQNAATDDRTICIAFHLKETVIPSALSFKLIGAAISIWPLKVVDARFCLYFQAAIMDADNRNELQIHVKGQRIFAYLINDVSKQLISPDLATTTQECLTLALGRILQFYHRCFGKQSHHLMSDLFEIEVGEVCSGKLVSFLWQTPKTNTVEMQEWENT